MSGGAEVAGPGPLDPDPGHRASRSSPRQGPRPLRRRPGPLGHGGLGPGERLRRGLRRAHPRQGPGAHGHDRLLVRRAGRPGPGQPAQRRPSRDRRAGPGLGRPRGTAGRAMLVRRAEMLHLECIVRGYLAGSAFKEYQAHGTVHGTPMPVGLKMADRLDEPMFAPSTKADEGHDVNIDFAAAVELVGADEALAARHLCLDLYRRAAERAAAAGFILADTKFELGYVDGALTVCDEVVTPDSSRLWPADQVVPGTTPPAFDKQPLRDWAAAGDWTSAATPGTARRGRGRHLGPLRGRLRTDHRAQSGRLVRCGEMRFMATRRGEPAARDRRPGGCHDRAGAARTRLRRGSRRAGRALLPLLGGGRRRGDGPGPGRRARPPAAGQPGDRTEPPGAGGDRVGRLMATRVGVVVFPGTNCEHDVVAAVDSLGGQGELVWHGQTSLGPRRGGPPGRLRPR